MTTTETVEYEAWQNATLGRVVVIKLDARGQQRHELIGAGKTFHITPVERRMNQERAASEELDVFTNGTLQPVHLLENAEDFSVLQGNPNHINENDVRLMFRLKLDDFRERVSQITNPAALERLLEVARHEDVRAQLLQYEAIKERLAQVTPSLHGGLEEAVSTRLQGGPTHAGPPTGINAVTPR